MWTRASISVGIILAGYFCLFLAMVLNDRRPSLEEKRQVLAHRMQYIIKHDRINEQ